MMKQRRAQGGSNRQTESDDCKGKTGGSQQKLPLCRNKGVLVANEHIVFSIMILNILRKSPFLTHIRS